MGEGFGVNADDIKAPERLLADPVHNLGHHALAPIGLGQPVPQLGRFAVNIALKLDADAAHGPAADGDRVDDVLSLLDEAAFDKALGVGQGIGAGENVPQVGGHSQVVGRLGQAGRVFRPPGAQCEIHGISSFDKNDNIVSFGAATVYDRIVALSREEQSERI